MIHPASEKWVALSVVAGEALKQGSVLRLLNIASGVAPGDTGRMLALKATASTDITKYGTFLAYWISPDSEDTLFTGKPESTDFTLNTGTGVGGGMHTIASGTEFTALGGRGVMIRLDKNSLEGTPSSLATYTVGSSLDVKASSGLLDTQASGDINVDAALVVANDGNTLVVMLA